VNLASIFGFQGCKGRSHVNSASLFGFQGCKGRSHVNLASLFGFQGCKGRSHMNSASLFGFQGCKGSFRWSISELTQNPFVRVDKVNTIRRVICAIGDLALHNVV
jgi:hypothetical protein